jgi:hypothetical protein
MRVSWQIKQTQYSRATRVHASALIWLGTTVGLAAAHKCSVREEGAAPSRLLMSTLGTMRGSASAATASAASTPTTLKLPPTSRAGGRAGFSRAAVRWPPAGASPFCARCRCACL